jgi:hypothetical protein
MLHAVVMQLVPTLGARELRSVSMCIPVRYRYHTPVPYRYIVATYYSKTEEDQGEGEGRKLKSKTSRKFRLQLLPVFCMDAKYCLKFVIDVYIRDNSSCTVYEF